MMPSAKDLDNLLLIVLHSSEALVTLGRLSVYLGNFNVLCFRILVLLAVLVIVLTAVIVKAVLDSKRPKKKGKNRV